MLAARLLASSSCWSPAWAVAEPREEAVRFQYDAPVGCPDASAFAASVRKRTARARAAEPGELARTFVIRIRSDAQAFSGVVEFLGEGGVPVSRDVSGEQCDAVVSSLALITALSLDATLNDEPAASRPTIAAPGVPQSPPASVPPPPQAAPVQRRATPPGVVRITRAGLGARVGVHAGYASTIEGWTFGLLGQLDWRNGFGLRFAPHYAASEREVDAGRRAEVRLLGLRSSGCYVVFRAQELALIPCASVDFGSLRAGGIQSEALPEASSDTVAWAAVGPELGVTWEPSTSYWLELNGGVQFPLVAHEFRFELPRRQAFVVPVVAARLGLSTGVRFW